MAPDDVPSVTPDPPETSTLLPPLDAHPPEPSEAAQSGEPLYQGRYVMGPPLGKGGTSTVYRAWDTDLKRHVAIKRLQPPLSLDAHARTRFNREGKAIARLSHPNLVTLIDRGSTDTEEYLVFQYVHGRSLKDLIRATGPLEVQDAGQIAGQIAEGLAQAHLAGIVHRDVKPQNILLDAEGRVKLIDFGIATGADWTQVTREGSIIGSSRYMSPEQVQGRPVDERTDIYSLGIVMYEMLTGEPPFHGTTVVEIGRQHVRDRPKPLVEVQPETPPAVDRIVLRCLEKLPESRFQSMDELLGALIALDLYRPQHAGGGLLGALRRTVLGPAHPETLSDSSEWTPPPGTYPDLAEADAASYLAGAGGEAAGDRDKLSASPRRTDLKRRRRRRGRGRGGRRLGIIALGAVVVTAVVLGAWALFWNTGTAPDLLGKSVDEAKSIAAAAGLKIEVDAEQQLVPGTAAGTVVKQEPAAGAAVPQETVRVVVTREPTAVKLASLKDLDPEGDKKENHDLLPQLIDGDETTGWSTESYKSAAFGNLKQGVGVAFELDSSATMLEITSPVPGWAGEVQAPDAGGQMTKVATLDGSNKQVVDLGRAVQSGRIWITKLAADPKNEGRFNAQLSDLRFYR